MPVDFKTLSCSAAKGSACTIAIVLFTLCDAVAWGPSWFKKSYEEMINDAEVKRDKCLAKAAKEASSDLGFRVLASQCYKAFNEEKKTALYVYFDDIYKETREGRGE